MGFFSNWICLCVASDTSKDTAVAELQKQIDNIIQELNLLKEQQALQTGKPAGKKIFTAMKKGYKNDSVFLKVSQIHDKSRSFLSASSTSDYTECQ